MSKPTFYIRSTGEVIGPNYGGVKGKQNQDRKDFGNIFQSESEALAVRGGVQRALKKKSLYKGEKIIRVVSSMGLSMGSFVAHDSALPYLAKLNHDSEFPVYFRWNKIKKDELGI